MKKLLNRPLKVFTLYALLILICSIPVYYFIAEKIWLAELDEHNITISGELKENLISHSPSDSLLLQHIKLWNKLQPVANIKQVKALLPDSFYNAIRPNKYLDKHEAEDDRFRGLVSYFSIRNNYYQVTVESNVEETHETILAITIITIVFFLLLFTGFILLNKRISASIWKPFYKTLEKIKAFELNDQQSLQFDPTTIIEFEELNKSLSRLIDKNISTFKEQKEFTENASHELQTPLAIIQNKLDLLLQSSDLSAEQFGIVEDTFKALNRMSRINRSLLLLAKIENSQFADKENVDMNQLVQGQLELLAEHIDSRILEVYNDENGLRSIPTNKTLAETLISNLLINAIRYTDQHGKIVVKVLTDKLIISNSGEKSLDQDKLFKRFSSQSFSTSGSGLGLNIVRQICNRYNWKPAYNYENGFHHFSVNF